MREYTNLFFSVITLLVLTPCLVAAQEQVKLAFFKQGVLEYQISEKFSSKLPEAGIIGMMVPLPDSVEYCNKMPIMVHDKILLLKAHNGCNEEQACKIAAESGAAAAVIIRNDAQKNDYSHSIPQSIKIPCVVVSEGTGLYYRGLLKKPSLVSLSAAAYDGKVVTGQTPRVKNLYVDQNTAAYVKKTSTETIAPPPPAGTSQPYVAYSATSTSIKIGQPTETVSSVPIASTQVIPVVEKQPEPVRIQSVSFSTPANKPEMAENKPPVIESTSTITSTSSITLKNTAIAPSETFKGMVDVYPVKVSEILLISYDLDVTASLTILLVNDKGEKVKEIPVANAKIGMQEIEVTNLPMGSYEVQVSDGVNTFKKKITVEH
jgi:hypothetical protein